MPEAPILGRSETVALDDAVFGAPFNGPLVHEAVVAELAARRRGTHSTLTRGRVSGGTSKPWRQKGTGRARAGSIRSPLWDGGGVVFGPKPRHYTVKVNRKARRAALRSALSVHAERGTVSIVDAHVFGPPSTKQARSLLDGRLGGSVLVVLTEDELNVAKSFRNLAGVSVLPVGGAGIADIVGAASLVVSRAALPVLTERAGKEVSRGAAVASGTPLAAPNATPAEASASAQAAAAAPVISTTEEPV